MDSLLSENILHYRPFSINKYFRNLFKGLLEILIKIYRPKTNIKFPEGGKLTPYLENLKPGDFINADGPHGKFSYSRGHIKIA